MLCDKLITIYQKIVKKLNKKNITTKISFKMVDLQLIKTENYQALIPTVNKLRIALPS